MKYTNFLNDIISSDKALDKLFQELPLNFTANDFQELYDSFYTLLEKTFKTFPPDHPNPALATKFDMDDSTFKRVSIAANMLDALSKGGLNNQELFIRTEKFVSEKKSSPVMPSSRK